MAALLGLLLVGCANIRAPGGGPEDEGNPSVASSHPDSGAVGIAGLDSLVFTFDEPMDRRSVEQAFRIAPELEFRKRRWIDRSWVLWPSAELAESTTYVAILGSSAQDRRDNKLGTPWVLPFSTGEALDRGSVAGKVIGKRLRSAGVWVYLWPWSAGIPDTTVSGFPPEALRVGQTNDTGEFELGFVPIGERLQLSALFDRDGDGQFQPLPDRWMILPEPVALTDSLSRLEGVEFFLTEPDEPGTVSGTLVDSSCVILNHRDVLRTVRAERDSLLDWLEGEWDARQRGKGTLNTVDSLRMEAEFAEVDRRENEALLDSAFCAQPFRAELRARPDSIAYGQASNGEFSWADVTTGVYRVHGFRDVNGNETRDPGEPVGEYPFAIEVAPLRVLDELAIELRLPEGESRLEPSLETDADGAESDSTHLEPGESKGDTPK